MERRIPWWLRKKDDKQTASRPVTDYTAVSAVSLKILHLLQDNLVPGLLQSRDTIGLCSPEEHQEVTLGLYLYDMRESVEARVNGFQTVNQEYQQYPPMCLELYYAIVPFLNMDLRYRSEEEHRLLGGVLQLIHDTPVLEPEGSEEELTLQLCNLSVEEKMKLWSGFGVPYRLALFYKAAPVTLESTLFKRVTGVKEMKFNIDRR